MNRYTIKVGILFAIGAFAAAMTTNPAPASALTCSQQCYANFQACLQSSTPKPQCNMEKNECLSECQ
ncbi:hypothetical protein [Paraliomyxa miuraensis]|uniref:hypothetical protein n=1 Tax=Paraliomyxa miuraensis TaxID=376150 RepID=UPI002250757E|nr:hypothetical protein [Paraliomyxa miuraensis]MCX4247191.1 hypothetical protein [Paraliomyxa miuraensis]